MLNEQGPIYITDFHHVPKNERRPKKYCSLHAAVPINSIVLVCMYNLEQD